MSRSSSSRESLRAGRVFKRYPAAELASARVEARVQRALHRRGLAPQLLKLERTSTGVVLESEAIGRAWPRRARATHLEQLGAALARLHKIRPPAALRAAAGRELSTSIVAYCQATTRFTSSLARAASLRPGERNALRRWSRALERGLAPLAQGLEPSCRGARRSLCHGDLQASNLRLTEGQVCFIDLEMSRVADPAWDLANACLWLGLSASQEDTLLASYQHAGRHDATLLSRCYAYRMVGLCFTTLDLTDRLRARLAGEAHPPLRSTAHVHLLETRSRTALGLLTGREPPPLTSLLERLGVGV